MQRATGRTTLVLITGCTSSTVQGPESAETAATASAETRPAAADPLPAVSTRFGNFPAFPEAQLPDSVPASLQSVLDQVVAADGWHMRTDPATLARWGYELYGGSVISDAALREMTDFGGAWYGLEVIDFADPDSGTFDTPAVGHGGSEESHFVRLVAFLRTGLVIAVQANADDFGEVEYVLSELRDVVQPSK